MTTRGESQRPDNGAASIVASTAVSYEWNQPRREMFVTNISTSGCKLLVKFNASHPASPTNWDVEVLPGDLCPGPETMHVASVSIYNAGASAMVLGTGFVAAGWA